MDFNGKNIVLAVDDSLMVCKQIQTALKDEPVFLCEAHNGQVQSLWSGLIHQNYSMTV